MTKTVRKDNFSPGPATLPLSVLEKVQQELIDYQGLGFSLLENSHRSELFVDILNSAKKKLLDFLGMDNYTALFLHGGASSEFYRIPMNLLTSESKVDFIETGIWAKKAFKEAGYFGKPRVAASSKDQQFCIIPETTPNDFDPEARYVYLCSNNTIYGTQYQHYPETNGIPLAGDFTSDLLSRLIDPAELSRFGIIFAGIQKNFGPSGLSIVLIRDDILEQCRSNIPSLCSYKVNAEANSLFNTTPIFQVYFVNLMLEWMQKEGGLEEFDRRNRRKAEQLYRVIDEFDIYRGSADKKYRSMMNATWTLPNEDMTAEFINQAAGRNIIGIKGHKLAGGLRASLYNAVSEESVGRLCDFMRDFAKNNLL